MVKGCCFLPLKTRKAPEIKGFEISVKYWLRRCEVMACAIVKFCANAQSEVKCATHARRHFTCRRHTSRTEGVLHVPQGTLS